MVGTGPRELEAVIATNGEWRCALLRGANGGRRQQRTVLRRWKGGGVRSVRGRSVSISLLANDRVLVEPLSGCWTGIGL